MNKYELLKKKIKNVETKISKNRERILSLNQEQKILEEQLSGMKKLEKRYEEIEKATDQFLLSTVDENQSNPTTKLENDLNKNQEPAMHDSLFFESKSEGKENNAKGD